MWNGYASCASAILTKQPTARMRTAITISHLRYFLPTTLLITTTILINHHVFAFYTFHICAYIMLLLCATLLHILRASRCDDDTVRNATSRSAANGAGRIL